MEAHGGIWWSMVRRTWKCGAMEIMVNAWWCRVGCSLRGVVEDVRRT